MKNIKNSYNKIDTSRKIDDSKWKKLISEEENDTYKINDDLIIKKDNISKSASRRARA